MVDLKELLRVMFRKVAVVLLVCTFCIYVTFFAYSEGYLVAASLTAMAFFVSFAAYIKNSIGEDK